MKHVILLSLLRASLADIAGNCQDGHCMEDERTVMLQATKPHTPSFLELSLTTTTSATCTDGAFDGEFTNNKDKVCGSNDDSTICGRDEWTLASCWDSPCPNSVEKEYTYKFSDGGSIGATKTITPPISGICITASCVKAGSAQSDAGKECFTYDPPQCSVTLSGPGTPAKEISNYKIQYECCDTCTVGSTSTAAPDPPQPTSSTTGGGGDGDPHIQTMKGDKYTLLKQGTFLAWSFKGKDAVAASPFASPKPFSKVPVNLELFAHYSNGRESFTRGLLLLDHQGQAMEMTSNDCSWRVQEGGSNWETMAERAGSRKSDLLYSRGGNYGTNFNISGAETTYELTFDQNALDLEGSAFSDEKIEKYRGTVVKGVVIMNMNTEKGMVPVAKLKVRCYPGFHLNYQMQVYNPKDDLPFMGGEVSGNLPGSEDESQQFLHLGEGSIQLRSDSRFQSDKAWQELGGTAGAALYLQSEDGPAGTEDANNLIASPCASNEEKKAMKICQEARWKRPSSRSFAECVFDVCRAGANAIPELIEILKPDEDDE